MEERHIQISIIVGALAVVGVLLWFDLRRTSMRRQGIQVSPAGFRILAVFAGLSWIQNSKFLAECLAENPKASWLLGLGIPMLFSSLLLMIYFASSSYEVKGVSREELELALDSACAKLQFRLEKYFLGGYIVQPIGVRIEVSHAGSTKVFLLSVRSNRRIFKEIMDLLRAELMERVHPVNSL